MRCPNHPKYQGLTKLGKRNSNCVTCIYIHDMIKKEREERKRQKFIYNSLSTPNRKSDLAHILAETMTFMKFGLQSENFWQKEDSTPIEVKKYFLKSLKLCHIWVAKNNFAANSLRHLFYVNVIMDEINEDIKNTSITYNINENKEIKKDLQKSISKSTLLDCKPSKNLFGPFGEEIFGGC